MAILLCLRLKIFQRLSNTPRRLAMCC
jgi:hypothetical protein